MDEIDFGSDVSIMTPFSFDPSSFSPATYAPDSSITRSFQFSK